MVKYEEKKSLIIFKDFFGRKSVLCKTCSRLASPATRNLRLSYRLARAKNFAVRGANGSLRRVRETSLNRPMSDAHWSVQ